MRKCNDISGIIYDRWSLMNMALYSYMYEIVAHIYVDKFYEKVGLFNDY